MTPFLGPNAVVAWMRESGVDEVELSPEGLPLRIKLGADPNPAQTAPVDTAPHESPAAYRRRILTAHAGRLVERPENDGD